MDNQNNPPADTTHTLLTLQNGDNVLITNSPVMSLQVEVAGNPVINEQPVILTDEQALDVMKKAEDNYVSLDTMGENISVIPKETSMDPTPDTQTEDPGDNQA